MHYTHIIWDWNGTLLDDVNAAVKSMNDLLTEYSMPLTSVSEYREMLEIPVINYYAKFFDLSKIPFQVLADKWSARYDRYLKEADLMNGARDILDYIENLGAIQIIVSSCQKDRILSCLERFKIKDKFALVSGADNNLSESKIERAAQPLKMLNGDPSKTLVIGDMVHDYEMASSLNADCVLIPDGQQNIDALRETGAFIFPHITDIPDFIKP